MASGSQTIGDDVVPKFDMHVYTSVLTSDEVKSLVAEYVIPIDLHPCVPPSGLTMNRLSADKIGIYDQYLELSGVRVPFSTFLLRVIKHFRNAVPWRHQDSSVADPAPIGVRAEDIRRLCENVIDLRPVHPAILYAVGLMTRWKHVGHHPVFKDVATSMSQFLKFLMAEGIPEKSDHQKVVVYENEMVFAVKRKAQAAKDREVGKRAATTPRHMDPTVVASVLITLLRLSTISFLMKLNSPPEVGSALLLVVHIANPSLGVILAGAALVCSFLYQVISYGMSHTIDLDLTLDNFLVCSQNQLSEDHKALQQVHLGCVRKEADLTEKLDAMEKERDDLLDKDREREERIKKLEADLASKTSSLTEAKGVVSTLKGDLERLTVDLSHAEIVRHNYVRQLLPTVFQRLLSSDENKKSLSVIFNLAIAAGWSKGVKAACFEEEAEAFLAATADYDPACKTTFMSEFDFLFNKIYLYVEKLAESFRLPLGDL
nr:transposase (putative), gypsy type [Tanacetum cinerariifolium]